MENQEERMTLDEQFENRVRKEIQDTKNICNYTPCIYIEMVYTGGALATAKKLIAAQKPSEGYTTLWEKGHLELTIEAIVIDEAEWQPLFTADEIAKARKRLQEYNYTFKGN
jgi:hypothetical protein